MSKVVSMAFQLFLRVIVLFWKDCVGHKCIPIWQLLYTEFGRVGIRWRENSSEYTETITKVMFFSIYCVTALTWTDRYTLSNKKFLI